MKGKHGQAAAVRHEVQSRDSEIATYQRAVARLTAENKALRASARDSAQSNQQSIRELRARLDVAAAPKVEALEIALGAARASAERTGREMVAMKRRYGRSMVHYMLALKELGITEPQTREALALIDAAAVALNYPSLAEDEEAFVEQIRFWKAKMDAKDRGYERSTMSKIALGIL